MKMLGTLCLLAAAVGGLPATSHAQDWPSHNVRVIVPYAPGGSTDVMARQISLQLTATLGQQVFVENRSGANGTLATDFVAKSQPDGYTILIAPNDIVLNQHIYKANYGVLKDFEPVIQLSRQPVVVAVHPSLGVKSVADLVALGKRQSPLSFATGSGAGSTQSIAMRWLARKAGFEVQQVPYRGGSAAVVDLLAGTMKVGSLGSTPVMPYYRSGALLLLAQSTKTRVASLPEVPTFEEAGIKGVVLDQWLGVFVPAKTPKPILERLNVEINKALASSAFKASLLKFGIDPAGGTPEAFRQLIVDDDAKYERLVKEFDVKVQ